MKTYYPVPLHIHSVWERNASMEGHFYNAQKLGIRHMYLTDHDIRMGRRKNHIDHFDFSKGQLRIEEPSTDPIRPIWHGFTVNRADEGTSAVVENGALTLSACSDNAEWTTVSTTFDTSQKRHEWALLGDVQLCLGLKTSETDTDTQIVIDVELSQRPPEFQFGHILYVFGTTEGLASAYAAIKPMKDVTEFTECILSLLQDAESVGGGDNVFRTVTFSVSARNGKSASLSVNKMTFSYGLSWEEGRREQQRLATEIGKKYGITPIVTTEFTAAGPHKICFSTKVPIIDYEARGYSVTDEEAMAHVRAYGGIYSRNHPFEHIKDAHRFSDSKEEQEALIDKVIEDVVTHRAWAAAAIEVGYPQKRETIGLDEHLRLWDALSAAGVFITGYGDSDNHNNDVYWFSGNNFVAYLSVYEPESTPGEEAFMAALLSGDVYTGDPVYLQNVEVTFVGSNGQQMGQVSTSATATDAVLTLTNVPEGSNVVWTVNGKTVKEEACAGSYSGRVALPHDEKVNFVRAALYKDGRCFLLTNPLYHTADPSVCIPRERRCTHA